MFPGLDIKMPSLPACSHGLGSSPFIGNASLPGIEDILLFVDKAAVTGLEDGTRQNPFHSVATAQAAALALTPGAGRRVTILIYPGEYAEDGLTSVDYVNWVGIGGRDAVRIEGSTAVTLTVTDEHTSYTGITFAQTDAFGIVTVSTAMTDEVEFHKCAFEGSGSHAALVAVNTAARALFKDCRLADTGFNILAPGSAGVVTLDGCEVMGGLSVNSGSFLYVRNSTIDGYASLNTNGEFVFESCEIVGAANPFIIYTQPATGIFRNNKFVSSSGYDISGNIAITGLVIEGNVMTRGIEADVSHIGSTRNVGAAGDLDFYNTTQDALTSCTFDDIVVKLLKDETLAAAAVVPSGRVVVLDGNGKHTLTRPNLTAITLNDSTLIVRDIIIVGAIDMNTVGDFFLDFIDSELEGRLYAFRGSANSKLRIIRSEVIGSASLAYAIRIDDADLTIVVEDSYLSGNVAGGQPAVYFVATNNNLKIRRSKFFHGSLGANNPFGRSAAQTPNWRGYQYEANADPDTSGWSTNLVAAGQQQASIDVNTDFY